MMPGNVSVCSICTVSAPALPVNGIDPDMPSGWSNITIAERGRHIANFVLCRTCTTAVRSTMSRLSEAYRDAVTA